MIHENNDPPVLSGAVLVEAYLFWCRIRLNDNFLEQKGSINIESFQNNRSNEV
nr:MAG TPA: hypothetical protein [Caudoviricetes sp.]